MSKTLARVHTHTHTHTHTQGNLINKKLSMINALLNIYIRDG